MKKRIALFCAFVLIFTTSISYALFGHGPVPGVDIPIDPGAFWDPDIPDYADDGNVYSLRQLAGGNVYDHQRNVNNQPITIQFLNDVSNTAVLIGNQVLNLNSMPSEALTAHSNAIENKLNQSKFITDQSSGLLIATQTKEQVWNETFPSFLSFLEEPISSNERIEKNQIMENRLDQTFLDGARIFKNHSQIQQDIELLQNIFLQNSNAAGNKHTKQVTGQVQAIKTSQILQQIQGYAALTAAITAGKEARVQKDLEAKQDTFKGLNIGTVDPYNPTTADNKNFERPQGQGFIHF